MAKNTIWKQVLTGTPQEIEVPVGTKFLTAAAQGDNVCVWYRCDPDQQLEKRVLMLCGTGHDCPTDFESRYLGTTHLTKLGLVFHVFEMLRR